MALISAAEWIDRYQAEAHHRPVRNHLRPAAAFDARQPLRFHIASAASGSVAVSRRAMPNARRSRRWSNLARPLRVALGGISRIRFRARRRAF